jgi:hypothetical protein
MLVLAFLGVILAAVAAVAAWRTASETKRMVQASVILQIRQQFNQLGALDKRIAPKNFDVEAVSVINMINNEADIYIEMVKLYYSAFHNVMCLITTNTIDEAIVNKIINPLELEAFIKIVRPLDKKLAFLSEHSAFEFWDNFAKKNERDLKGQS